MGASYKWSPSPDAELALCSTNRESFDRTRGRPGSPAAFFRENHRLSQNPNRYAEGPVAVALPEPEPVADNKDRSRNRRTIHRSRATTREAGNSRRTVFLGGHYVEGILVAVSPSRGHGRPCAGTTQRTRLPDVAGTVLRSSPVLRRERVRAAGQERSGVKNGSTQRTPRSRRRYGYLSAIFAHSAYSFRES